MAALGGKETDVSIPGHRLLLLSWGPLPHLLPHFPFFLPSPHPQWFFCVNCAVFILFPFFPFSQRNKGLEIAGFLVLVTSMENGLHTRVSALIPGEALFTGCGISLGGTAGLQGRGSTSVAGQQSPVASLPQTLAKYVEVKSRCLGTRLHGSKSQFFQLIAVEP